MVGYSTAIKEVIENAEFCEKIRLDVKNALNHVLFGDIFSSINFPPFNQSAMDGYAISARTDKLIYKVAGEIVAGDDASDILLRDDEAVRIFTGAMLPKNAIAVIKQEDVCKQEDFIQLKDDFVADENIRFIGEQTKKNDLILTKNTLLTPGIIGYLAMLGIFEVEVYKKPTITVIATGNELINKKEKLTGGKIYESNTYTLLAALQQYGFTAKSQLLRDDFEKIKTVAEKSIQENDVIIFTGGISVGDYDFVRDVLFELGVKEIFYKVKQKPGKPLFFGTSGKKIIFALPGNPAAVLTSFYIYVLEALSRLSNNPNIILSRKFKKLDSDYIKSKNLTCFLKGKIFEDKVNILRNQSSAMLSSFVDSDCLIILPEGKSEYQKGEEVEVVCYM